ncbi:RcnB family protein [Dyella silvatica]|uniref:RcnB family protein n=1 Tax=Dyella silvatica TaxID=2992128 RepID=UPI0022572627|nr:RcnB family protein [Dyella silvatica]
MKRFLIAVASLSMFALSTAALAAPPQDQDHGRGWVDDGHGHGRDDDRRDDRHDQRDHDDRDRDDRGRHDDRDRHDNGWHAGWDRRYGRGDHLPERYRGRDYYVDDYPRYHLHEPRPGYRWIRGDGGQFVLIAITTGVIVEVLSGN